MTDDEMRAEIARSKARTKALHERADQLEAETREIRAQVWELGTYILKNERLTRSETATVLRILGEQKIDR